MNNKKRLFFIYIPLAGIVLLVTFIAGAYIGLKQFMDWDSSAKAMLLMGELKVIRDGEAEKLIKTKEISLDGEIVRSMQFQESSFGAWIFYPLAHNNHDIYLKHVAKYRKKHPSKSNTLEFDKSDTTMQEYQAEITKRNEQLIELYGNE